MEKEKKGLNNKGFSLVELIIVIAIMAILAAALAPQLMRYIEKSRVAVDDSNCDAIKSAVETTLAEEAAFEAIPSAGLTFTFNGTAPADTDYKATGVANFSTELEKTITDWPKVKAKGKTKFQVVIDADKKVTVSTLN